MIIALATRPAAWQATLEADYATRIGGFALQTHLIKPTTPTKDAAATKSRLPKKSRLFCLDADGETYNSDSFAAFLQAELEGTHTPVFVIGAAAGLSQELRTAADKIISLSPLTFAHATARLLLVEQLYRADCKMRGHPYLR